MCATQFRDELDEVDRSERSLLAADVAWFRDDGLMRYDLLPPDIRREGDGRPLNLARLIPP